MPPLYESARNDYVAASKDRHEAAEGLRDVLQADSQFLRGEIGVGETLRREGSGITRAVSGSLGSLFRSGLSEGESATYGGILPAITICDKQQSESQNTDSEGDMTRQIKKDKACYLGNQPSDMVPAEDMTRQIKKDKGSYLENQPSEFSDQ